MIPHAVTPMTDVNKEVREPTAGERLAPDILDPIKRYAERIEHWSKSGS